MNTKKTKKNPPVGTGTVPAMEPTEGEGGKKEILQFNIAPGSPKAKFYLSSLEELKARATHTINLISIEDLEKASREQNKSK